MNNTDIPNYTKCLVKKKHGIPLDPIETMIYENEPVEGEQKFRSEVMALCAFVATQSRIDALKEALQVRIALPNWVTDPVKMEYSDQIINLYRLGITNLMEKK